MSRPSLARQDEAGDRFYPWKGESYYSVTTIIGGGLPKFALPPWYAKQVAELVVDDMAARGPHSRGHAAIRRWAKAALLELDARQAAGELLTIKASKLSDRELALRFIKGAPNRTRDAAAELGIEVHDEAEQTVLRLARDTAAELIEPTTDGVVWPAHLAGYRDSFVAFMNDWRPVFAATEATVFNREQAYAGTLDAIALVTVERVPMKLLIDYKSGGKIHPEVGLQLAAYARADFIGLADGETEIPMPPVDGAAVLQILPAPDKAGRRYHFRLVKITPPIYNAFLFAREGYRWHKELGRDVLGPDLDPSVDEPIVTPLEALPRLEPRRPQAPAPGAAPTWSLEGGVLVWRNALGERIEGPR